MDTIKRYWWILALALIYCALRSRRNSAEKTAESSDNGKAFQSVKLEGGGYTIAGVGGYEYKRDPWATGRVGKIGTRNRVVRSV